MSSSTGVAVKKTLAYLVFCSIGFLIYYSPTVVKRWLGHWIGWMWFSVLRIRRELVLDNLRQAFPEKSEEECIRIGRASVDNMGHSAIDFLCLPFMSRDDILHATEVEGEENLLKALEQGRGVCGLCLHLGNADMGAMGIVAYGFDAHIIVKPFSTQWFHYIVNKIRVDKGVSLVPPEGSTKQILTALEKSGLVVFTSDQFMARPRGVRTFFFGRPTGTAAGLAVLARKAKSPVVPFYSYRKGIGKYVIKIGEIIPFEEDPDRVREIQKNTQIYTTCIENIIRERPEQWLWVHKRWKPGFE